MALVIAALTAAGTFTVGVLEVFTRRAVEKVRLELLGELAVCQDTIRALRAASDAQKGESS